MKPQNDTYDVTIEAPDGHHYRIYLRFTGFHLVGPKHQARLWAPGVLFGRDLTTQEELTEDQLEQLIPNFQQLFHDAVQGMKWAILNEPDDVRPDLIEFIKQI